VCVRQWQTAERSQPSRSAAGGLRTKFLLCLFAPGATLTGRLTSGLEGRVVKLQKAVLRLAAAALVVVGMFTGCSSKQSSSPASPGGASTTRAAPPPVTGGERPATGCTAPAGTASAMSARPTGLVAFDIYEKGKVPFPKRIFRDAVVSGVDVDIKWDNLEPASNTFDWSALDCLFAEAAANQKFVVLAVIPGFRSPSWVLQLPGVETQSFKFAYFNKETEPRALPLPWNEAYLQAWFTFLGALAQRYANSPEFRMIQVAGPTSVSTEMSLPDRKTGDTGLPASANGSDIAEWKALGYTPDKYVNAWKETFDQYHQLFPHQYLSLSLYPGLPIGNNEAKDARARIDTVDSVIAAGMRYKEQFALQENGIRGRERQPSDHEYDEVRNHCGDIVTGLQNSKSATKDPEYQGPLDRALDHVTAAGVDFWEVYAADVDNRSMTDVLKRASTQLPAHAQCKH
jgi:Beta-galactosidase